MPLVESRMQAAPQEYFLNNAGAFLQGVKLLSRSFHSRVADGFILLTQTAMSLRFGLSSKNNAVN